MIPYFTVSSVTNCPVPSVPAPPAVTVIAPVVPIVPARSPATPAAVLVWVEKFPTAPTVGAEVLTASACVYDCEKLNEFPLVC